MDVLSKFFATNRRGIIISVLFTINVICWTVLEGYFMYSVIMTIFLWPYRISGNATGLIVSQKRATQMPVMCVLFLFFIPIVMEHGGSPLSNVAFVLFALSAYPLIKLRSDCIFDIEKSSPADESVSGTINLEEKSEKEA